MPVFTSSRARLATACALACTLALTLAVSPGAACPFSGPCAEEPTAELPAGERALILLMVPTLLYAALGVGMVVSGIAARHRSTRLAAIGFGLGAASVAAGLYAAHEWQRPGSESPQGLGYATAIAGSLAIATGVTFLFGHEPTYSAQPTPSTLLECTGRTCRANVPAPVVLPGAGGSALGVGVMSGTF
jgi:hypothetical protein